MSKTKTHLHLFTAIICSLLFTFPCFALEEEPSALSNVEESFEFNVNNTEALFSRLNPVSVVTIGIGLVFIIVLFVFSLKKKGNKSADLHNEISGYMAVSREKHEYSGNIYVLSGGIEYIRGNRRTVFPITIAKQTYLAPILIKKWFEDRNYNLREEKIILSDIREYLISNKYTKEVFILTDDEYEDLSHDTDDEEFDV